MLQLVDVGPKSIDKYSPVVGGEKIAEIRGLAGTLRGARVAHVNATSYGGGVSELLRSLVPLYRSLGIEADWLVIPGATGFFEITKGLHNALQGADFALTEEVRRKYVDHNQ